MIIKREYVPFGVLMQKDFESKAIFEKALKESFPEEECERVRANLFWLCLYQREMDWAFRKLGDVIEGFERLDKEKPFDNGLGYEDVNEVELVSGDEEGVVLHLLNRFDGFKTIVKVVEIFD